MPQKADSPPDQIAIAVGSRIRQEREARRMTKEALGERAQLASRYIWRVEDGRQNIQLRNLARIAAAMDTTLAALLTGVEELVAKPVKWPSPKPRGRRANAATSAD